MAATMTMLERAFMLAMAAVRAPSAMVLTATTRALMMRTTRMEITMVVAMRRVPDMRDQLKEMETQMSAMAAELATLKQALGTSDPVVTHRAAG